MGTPAYIPIYSKRLAGYLLLKGFLLEDYQKSHEDSERTIFFFYESEELLRAMSEYNRLKNYKGGHSKHMSKVINQKYMSFEEVVIESENEEDYKESLDTMRKAGFTRVKIYDNESMTMIPAKKILKNGHIVQRYKRFGGYEIIESKLRAELPKGVKPADRKEENK